MKYRSVTIWHPDGEGGFERELYEKALISSNDKIEMGGDFQTASREMTVRIFSKKPCVIFPGDYICRDYDEAPTPPVDSLFIVSVTSFFGAGATRHYRLDCK